MKRYIIFAGVNGAGKSTLYRTFTKFQTMHRINADEILRGFGDWRNTADIMKAGKMAVSDLNHCLSNGISFNQETTLCGKSILKTITKAKALGYNIELYYVGIGSADLAKQRIEHRVGIGGHGIPAEDVEKRYIETFENLKIVLPLCDLASIYDNTGVFRRIAIYKNGNLVRLSHSIPEWLLKIIN